MADNEYGFRKVDEGDQVTLQVRYKRIPYDRVMELLNSGYDVFMDNLGRSMARYIKLQLIEKMGHEITATPAIIANTTGYLFKVSHRDDDDMPDIKKRSK